MKLAAAEFADVVLTPNVRFMPLPRAGAARGYEIMDNMRRGRYFVAGAAEQAAAWRARGFMNKDTEDQDWQMCY